MTDSYVNHYYEGIDKTYYEGIDTDAAENYLCTEINDKGECKRAKNVAVTLQKLHLASLENNFLDLYGTAYRWLIVQPSDTDIIEAASAHKILQICDNKGKWINFLERKKSNFAAAEMGLFALKRFSKNECICIYAGHCCWKSEEVQETEPEYLTRQAIEDSEPTDEYLSKQGIEDSDYCVNIYAPLKKQWMCVDPSKENEDGNMYMGAHFINSATLGYTGKTKLHDYMKSSQNCRILCDGLIMAVKCINKGDEIYTGYTNSSNQKTKFEKKEEKTVSLIVDGKKYNQPLFLSTSTDKVEEHRWW